MIACVTFTINVLPRWDRYLHAFTQDIHNMDTDTLMYMVENPYVRAELIRRGALDGLVEEDHSEQEEAQEDECWYDYISNQMDYDFVPFGEDNRLPKSLRKRED